MTLFITSFLILKETKFKKGTKLLRLILSMAIVLHYVSSRLSIHSLNKTSAKEVSFRRSVLHCIFHNLQRLQVHLYLQCIYPKRKSLYYKFEG